MTLWPTLKIYHFPRNTYTEWSIGGSTRLINLQTLTSPLKLPEHANKKEYNVHWSSAISIFHSSMSCLVQSTPSEIDDFSALWQFTFKFIFSIINTPKQSKAIAIAKYPQPDIFITYFFYRTFLNRYILLFYWSWLYYHSCQHYSFLNPLHKCSRYCSMGIWYRVSFL